jgi:hypothetical protein
MKKHILLTLLLVSNTFNILAQGTFNYEVQLTPITIPNLPGLHSFAQAQHNGKWLFLTGRTDGIHARQPFNAFPESSNNTMIYVVDNATQQVWSASVASLPTNLAEQMQSTNTNFYQDDATLYLIGGYGFSVSANDHITFPYMTSVNVPGLIDAVVNATPITSHFKQISNPIFSVTGGQLGKIGSTFYLVGGHKFDGRYNPMNGPTFTQTYTNKIQKFTIDNSGTQLSFANYEAITDAVHLHRRDYNLIPQIFPNGEEGYTISSGVFQINADLPFLYPIDIKASGYFPQTQFNQYLSNYHSAKISMYNATENSMHSLFFGGISQYYYSNGALVQDNNVPFVKTISRVTRDANGTLTEYNLPIEMPSLKGSSAEFIPNLSLPHYSNEVFQLSNITQSEFVIGHIVGGIQSSSLNPFTNNQTSTTSASPTVYEVKLINTTLSNQNVIDGSNPFDFMVSPNPTDSTEVQLSFKLPYESSIEYLVTSMDGKLLENGEISNITTGDNILLFDLDVKQSQTVIMTLIFDGKYYASQKIILN